MRNFFIKSIRKIRRIAKKIRLKLWLLWGIIFFFIVGGFGIIWVSTFDLPNIDSFDTRRIAESTKIYDKTGEVILYDVHGEIKRTVVPLDEISEHMRWATIAIEDANFYKHSGIEPLAIVRAIVNNFKSGNLLGGEGGSTITQQVIKNALLTTDKKISRKIKEWVLAPRLERVLTKDEILATYLNEVPYGGTVYGVEEAARRFFAKDAKDLSLVESAYLAALPQAPTYFSPYGNNRERLDVRKDKVLRQMYEHEFISESEYNNALAVEVDFERQEEFGVKAAHFVFYIREQLEEKYGREIVEEGGLKVITTLDWDLQKEAEELVKNYAIEKLPSFGAENASIIAIDPNTGQILVMVGSRDYFDEEIDGNFNITTAMRQPGSAFKPFVYAAAFEKGYRPETVVFDVPTEFSVACARGGDCYSPSNYTGLFSGPISLRNALAQSVNVPSVKVFYLAGMTNALNLAKKMGIETLTNIDQYGLTLVLGGGEVRPIDMASAYGVFATGGVRNNPTGILRIEDKNGNVLEEFEEEPVRVLPPQTANTINSILSDNVARAPVFGANSYLNISPQVAVKTGTTNNFRDTWIVGYSTKLSVAAWAGNNDNRPMTKDAAASIVAPMWNEFMRKAIEKYPATSFTLPEPLEGNVKPIIAGNWQSGGGHSILHYVDKNDPLGDVPRNPNDDPQYHLWEPPVQAWFGTQSGLDLGNGGDGGVDKTQFRIVNPRNNSALDKNRRATVTVDLDNGEKIENGTVYINGVAIGTLDKNEDQFRFTPDEISGISDDNNILRVIVEDTAGDTHEDFLNFSLE